MKKNLYFNHLYSNNSLSKDKILQSIFIGIILIFLNSLTLSAQVNNIRAPLKTNFDAVV